MRRDKSQPIITLDRRTTSGDPPGWLPSFFAKAGTYPLPLPPDQARQWIQLVSSFPFHPDGNKAQANAASSMPSAMTPGTSAASMNPAAAMLGTGMNPMFAYGNAAPPFMMTPSPLMAMNNWNNLSILQQQQQLLLYQQQLQALLHHSQPMPLPTPTPPLLPNSSAVATQPIQQPMIQQMIQQQPQLHQQVVPSPAPTPTSPSSSSYTQRKPVHALTHMLHQTHLSTPTPTASQSAEKRKMMPRNTPSPSQQMMKKPKRKVQFKSTDVVYEFEPDAYWEDEQDEQDDELDEMDEAYDPRHHHHPQAHLSQQHQHHAQQEYYENEEDDYYDEELDDVLQRGTAYDQYDESDYEQRYYMDQYYHHHHQLPPVYRHRHPYYAQRIAARHPPPPQHQHYYQQQQQHQQHQQHHDQLDDMRGSPPQWRRYNDEYEQQDDPRYRDYYYQQGYDDQDDDESHGQHELEHDDALEGDQRHGDEYAPRPRSTGYYMDYDRARNSHLSPQLGPSAGGGPRARPTRHHSARVGSQQQPLTASPSSSASTRAHQHHLAMQLSPSASTSMLEAGPSSKQSPSAAAGSINGTAGTNPRIWQPSRTTQQQWNPAVRRSASTSSANLAPIASNSPSRRYR